MAGRPCRPWRAGNHATDDARSFWRVDDAVVRWDPWSELDQLQREVSDLFSRRMQPARVARPAMDAVRTDAGTIVRLDVPGFAPDEVQVSVHEGVLTLPGTKSSESEEGNWIRRELAEAQPQQIKVTSGSPDASSATIDVGNTSGTTES